MTEQELDILAQDSSRELIERHIGEDPARAALRLGPHAALLSTQIKYLQRAKTKLPSYHRARCIIPPLAFEQASSEAAAEAKTYEGGLCIDLTCGLGVDSLMLSRRFRRVVSLERDPVLALVARYNFERLEARNIEVICTSAETFVAEFAGTADLIYADPARRDGLVRLEECSPDVRSLMPRLRQIARRIVVKASPLFDTDEAFALFGGEVSVEAVSLHGECKELLIDLPGTDRPEAPGLLRATAIGRGTRIFHPEQLRDGKPDAGFDPPYGFLLVPDVSLYKIRAARCYLQSAGAFAASETGLRVCTTFARRFPRTRVSDRRDRAVSSQGIENSVQNARHRTAEPAEKGFSARCRANRPGDRHPAGRQRHGGFHDGERATDRRHTVGRRTRKGQATLRTIHYICRTIDTQ